MNLTTNGTFPKTTEKSVTEWARLIVPITTDVKISWNGATAETSQKVISNGDELLIEIYVYDTFELDFSLGRFREFCNRIK
jgi:hypothetical protein